MNNDMDEKDDEIAHLSILANTAKRRNCAVNYNSPGTGYNRFNNNCLRKRPY